jgi:PHD/YefM family antitoxin component YafN of YafNO toxin-antitoxin module/mRNA-degrading endonuclease RelE of RelBE toxin-antitoxin system
VKRLNVFDLSEEARDLIRECEAKGTQTLFERNGRPVAVLVSHDEYLALRETIDIANDPLLFARIAEADQEASARVAESPSFRGLDRLLLAITAQESLDSLTGVARRRALSWLARINSDPIAGAPLFEPLKGLWSYRTDELRILYKIVSEARMVIVLAIDRVTATSPLSPLAGRGPG